MNWRRCRGRRFARCRRPRCRHSAAGSDRGARPAPAARHRHHHCRGDGAGRRRTARGAWLQVVLLPAITFAPAPFAAEFAGTIDTPAAATTALVAAIAGNAARHGVPMTVIANAHHDPAHVSAIRDAVPLAAARGATLVFPDLTRRRWAERLGDEFQSGACHAGRYEIDCARGRRRARGSHCMSGLPPNPQSLVDAIRRGDRSFAAAGGPEAYFGWPADASATRASSSSRPWARSSKMRSWRC